jgi:hypothetical protein
MINNLIPCSHCREQCYCSQACKKAHWKAGHKIHCAGEVDEWRGSDVFLIVGGRDALGYFHLDPSRASPGSPCFDDSFMRAYTSDEHDRIVLVDDEFYSNMKLLLDGIPADSQLIKLVSVVFADDGRCYFFKRRGVKTRLFTSDGATASGEVAESDEVEESDEEEIYYATPSDMGCLPIERRDKMVLKRLKPASWQRAITMEFSTRTPRQRALKALVDQGVPIVQATIMVGNRQDDNFVNAKKRRCGACRKEEPIFGKYSRCGKCRKEFYCSRDCQAAHWKLHKNVCGKVI